MKSMLKFLSFAVLLLAFAGCQKNEAAESGQYGVEVSELPTEDQIKITTDTPAHVFGQLNMTDLFEQSVQKRISKLTTLDEASVLIVPGDNQKSLSVDQYIQIYNHLSAEGSLIITNPNIEFLKTVFLVELGLAEWHESVAVFNTTINDEVPESKISDFLLSIFEQCEKADENLNYKAIGISHNGVVFIGDKEDDTTKHNAYVNGLLADGLASWMDESTKSETKSAAWGTKALPKSLTDTDPYTITLYSSPEVDWFEYISCYNMVKSTIEVYPCYSRHENAGYYQVNLTASFYHSLWNLCPKDRFHFWKSGYFGDVSYINYLKCWDNRLQVETNSVGAVKLLSAAPEASNGSRTESNSYSFAKGTSESDGFSTGFSFGIVSLFTANDSYNHTWTEIETETTTMGASRNVSDISVRLQRDPFAASASWTYRGLDARYNYIDGRYCWDVGELQYTDMTQTNSYLCKVNDIADDTKVILHIWNNFNYETASCSDFWEKKSNMPFQSYESFDKEDFADIVLPSLLRGNQKWFLGVNKYGDVTDVSVKLALDGKIQQLCHNSMVFNMPDIDDVATNTANQVFNLFMKDFQILADTTFSGLGVGGTFEFVFTRESDGVTIKKSYTISD